MEDITKPCQVQIQRLERKVVTNIPILEASVEVKETYNEYETSKNDTGNYIFKEAAIGNCSAHGIVMKCEIENFEDIKLPNILNNDCIKLEETDFKGDNSEFIPEQEANSTTTENQRSTLSEQSTCTDIQSEISQCFAQCEICQKIFYNMSSLHRHTKEVHMKLERNTLKHFKCPICTSPKYICKSNSTFREHIKWKHPQSFEAIFGKKLNAQEYVCNCCNKKFRASNNLKRHVEGVHKNLRPYKCSQCSYAAKESKLLQQHLKIHDIDTGIVQCEFCGKKLSVLTLKRHQNTVHKGIQNYECFLCSKKFTRGDNLKLHVKVHMDQFNTQSN